MTSSHAVDRIKVLDRMIADDEERMTSMKINVGNWKREREGLWSSLTAEEKKAFDPISPPEQTEPKKK